MCSMLQEVGTGGSGAGALQRKARAQLLAGAASKAVGELPQHPTVAQKANQAKRVRKQRFLLNMATCGPTLQLGAACLLAASPLRLPACRKSSQ